MNGTEMFVFFDVRIQRKHPVVVQLREVIELTALCTLA